MLYSLTSLRCSSSALALGRCRNGIEADFAFRYNCIRTQKKQVRRLRVSMSGFRHSRLHRKFSSGTRCRTTASSSMPSTATSKERSSVKQRQLKPSLNPLSPSPTTLNAPFTINSAIRLQQERTVATRRPLRSSFDVSLHRNRSSTLANVLERRMDRPYRLNCGAAPAFSALSVCLRDRRTTSRGDDHRRSEMGRGSCRTRTLPLLHPKARGDSPSPLASLPLLPISTATTPSSLLSLLPCSALRLLSGTVADHAFLTPIITLRLSTSSSLPSWHPSRRDRQQCPPCQGHRLTTTFVPSSARSLPAAGSTSISTSSRCAPSLPVLCASSR